MRISANTLRLLASLGDTTVKQFTRETRLPWIYYAHNGQITALCTVPPGKGKTMIGLPAVVPPTYA